MRADCEEKSRVISNVDSLAKRISPPGTFDCSGSQNLAEPFRTRVPMVAVAPVGPMASSARVTIMPGSRGAGGGMLCPQDAMKRDNRTADKTRFMVFSPLEQPPREHPTRGRLAVYTSGIGSKRLTGAARPR